MSLFEDTLAAALRDDAREIAMSVDMNDAYEVVEQRMGAVDGRRRTWRWAVAAAAAAAVAVAALLLGRPATAPDTAPAAPATGPTFRTTTFQPGFTASLPAWVAEVMSRPTAETADTVTWNRCAGDPVCVGLDAYSIRLIGRDDGRPATYAGYLAHLDTLRDDGSISITGSTPTTVDGRPATVLAITTHRGTADGMGCLSTLRCQDFFERNLTRYAVVDTGGVPLVIGMRTFADNPSGPAWLDQLDGVLATLRLQPRQVITTPDLVGTYDATVTRTDARQSLAAVGMGAVADTVLSRNSVYGGPRPSSLQLRLYVDGGMLRLYTVERGVETKIDEHAYDLVEGRVTARLDRGDQGTETFVADVTATAEGLRLTFVESAGPAADADVPNEAYQRVLYTSTPWTRST